MLMKKEKEIRYEVKCPNCGMEFNIAKPTIFRWDGKDGLIFPCPSCEKEVPIKKRKIKIRVIKSKKETGSN